MSSLLNIHHKQAYNVTRRQKDKAVVTEGGVLDNTEANQRAQIIHRLNQKDVNNFIYCNDCDAKFTKMAIPIEY